MSNFSLLSHDGLSLAGYHRPALNADAPFAVLILIHGVAEHSGRYEHFIDFFNKHNFAIVSMDLRGHGRSDGKHVFIPSIEAIFRDIDLLIKEAKKLYPSCRTILYGHSMGGSLSLSYTLNRFPTKNNPCPYEVLVVSSPWIRLARPFQPPRPVFSVIRNACRIHPSMHIRLRFDPNRITRDEDIIDSYNSDENVRRSATLSLAARAGSMAAKLDRTHAIFHIPVLIHHGEADSITCHRASFRFAQRGTNIDYMSWPNCFHELHSEPEREKIFAFTLQWIIEKLLELKGFMATATIPQSQPLTADQVPNNAGGFVWAVDDMQRLRRFLCLGSEGGTYQGEKELSIENAQAILRLIQNGRGTEVVETIKTYSLEGRTSKQNTLMFSLAICAKSTDLPTKQAAYGALQEVCRIPTHLFMFIKYAHALGQNWGRAQRRAVSKWYTEQNPSKLAMAITKYQNREGYCHRDILRLSHPKTTNPLLSFLFDYVTHGYEKALENLNKPKESTSGNQNAQASMDVDQISSEKQANVTAKNEEDEEDIGNKKIVTIEQLKDFIETVEKVKTLENEDELIAAIKKHHLVREHMPTKMLQSVSIWSTLLEKMPLTAMIRNLGKMSEINLLAENSEASRLVVQRLKDREQLQRARIHPFNVLVALETYKKGKGFKGKLTWEVNSQVQNALEEAFYLSFKFVKPTNQRYLLALDVSGSMSGGTINGSPSITPAVGAAAMSMVTLRTEPYVKTVAFSHELITLDIPKEASLEQVMEKTRNISFGGTDCGLPMLWAINNKEQIDVFIVYTDNETWAGHVHPTEALRQYREQMNRPNAKLIVVGMQSNGFTIADPNDKGMLDVVGFDSAAPQVMSLFAEGEI